MEKRYGALRFIAGLYIIGGLIIGGGAIVLAIVSMVSTRLYTSGLVSLIGAIVATAGIVAFGQLLNLMIDVEENTRASRMHLESLTRSRKQPDTAPVSKR